MKGHTAPTELRTQVGPGLQRYRTYVPYPVAAFCLATLQNAFALNCPSTNDFGRGNFKSMMDVGLQTSQLI